MVDEAVRRDIEARWSQVEADYERLRAEAEGRVVDREWGEPYGSWERPEPLYAERTEIPKGRLRRKRPRSLSGWKEYGYDEHGRVVLAREFSVAGDVVDDVFVPREPEVPADLVSDEYFVYGDRFAESYRFESGWIVEGPEFTRRWWVRLAAIAHQRLNAEGVLIGYDQYLGPFVSDGETMAGGWIWERYKYRPDGQVDRVFSRADQDAAAGSVQPWVYEMTYDDAGKLTVVRDATADWTVWRRPPKSLKPAVSLLEDALVGRVAEWARSNWPTEPAFALGLGSSLAIPYTVLPGIVTVRERDAWLEEDGVALRVWNPAEYATQAPGFELTEPADVVEAERLLRQEAELTDDEQSAAKLLGRVAKRLAGLDWSAFPRADDFVVFAMDWEIEDQADIEQALRRSVPSDTVRSFRQRGWLRMAE